MNHSLTISDIESLVGNLAPSQFAKIENVTIERQPFSGYTVSKGAFKFVVIALSDVIRLTSALLNESTNVYISSPQGVREAKDKLWSSVKKIQSKKKGLTKAQWFRQILTDHNIAPQFFGTASFNHGQLSELVALG